MWIRACSSDHSRSILLNNLAEVPSWQGWQLFAEGYEFDALVLDEAACSVRELDIAQRVERYVYLASEGAEPSYRSILCAVNF